MAEMRLHVFATGDTIGRAEVHELVVGACNRRIGKAGAEQTSYEVRERADLVHLLGEKDIR